MPKGTKLSKKEKGFARDYFKTGNGTQSALNNYDTTDENVANQIAIQNLRKPTIQNEIKSIADRIPDELLEKVHLEGLAATRIHSSMTEPDKLEVDYATRHKYMDSAYKLKGSYAPEKNVNMNVNTNVSFTAQEVERLKAKLKEKQTT